MEQTLGKFLKDKREQKRLTLRQVEEETGILNAYLSQLENGKIVKPSPGNLHKLAGLYSVPYSLLLQKAGYPVDEEVQRLSIKSRIAKELNNTSEEEQDKLIEYLRFLRSTKKG